MRDDCNVSAFRLHSFWIKLFTLFLVVLVGACAAGAYGTFYYKNRYELSSSERRELQRTLGENKIKLENLSNEELVGRYTESSPAASPNKTVSATNGGTVKTGRDSATAASSTATPTPADLARLLDQQGQAGSAGADSAAEMEAKMEKHPVKVSNLKSVFEGEDRIRVTYDLSNQQQGITLVGRCSIALVTRDGTVIDITPTARGVLTFQIARFRKMDILAQVPASVKRSDIAKVQISAKANEFPLYRKQFPIK